MPGQVNKKITWKTALISWILVFALKMLFAYGYCQLIFSQKPERKIGVISYASGDYGSYIGAMENYYQKKGYFFINQLGDTVRMGRQPYFAFPYWLARHFTDSKKASDFLTLVNVALDSLAIICLALMAAGMIVYSRHAFFTALVLGTVSTYVSNWTFITLPDGAGAALLMIGTYFYWRGFYSNEGMLRNMLGASFFFSWAIVLRPFLLIVVAAMALAFLIKKKLPLPSLLKLALIGLLPFLLFLLPWTIRNYNISGKIVPFQQDMYAGYGYRPSELQVRKLITSMGEDGVTFWNPYAMASYFSPDKFRTSQFQYPGYVGSDSVYIDKLEQIRGEYIQGFRSRNKDQEDDMVSRLAELRKTYIQKYGIHYYLLNPLRRTYKFWAHSGSYYISVQNENNLVVRLNKYFQSVLYFLVLFLGTFGLLRLARKDMMGWILLFPFIALTLMFATIYGFMEPRYAISFYYPGLLGLILVAEPLLKRLSKSRDNKEPDLA